MCQYLLCKDSRRRKEKTIKHIFEESMAGNFPNLKKGTNIQEQEAQKVPNKMNPSRTTPRHTIKNSPMGISL